jgi:pilus assembly protein CpaF
MGLGDRLRQRAVVAAPAAGGALPDVAPDVFHDLKGELHHRIVDALDLAAFEKLAPERRRDELRAVLASEVARSELPLNAIERERMVQELLDELTGLGPLEPLLADPTIADILVNGFGTVYIERSGRLELTPIRFGSNEHLMQIVNRIVSRVGRRVDETSPMVDARLPDGSRVNAIIPPLALDGPVLSIRRFGVKPFRMRDLVAAGALNPSAAGFLAACVRSKLNVLISGGTGAGKTTMLNALSAYIPDTERIVTIEDSAELQLQQRHVVRLETRPANIEGKGEIVTRDLVRNALRMRPDRIVVGEVRGGEVLDMLQAMNTGHEGSMTTVHANTPRDGLARLEAMIGMSGVPLSEGATRATISRALNVICQLSRGLDGRRRVTSIAELTGTEGATITMQDVFVFEQRGVDAQGHVVGEFRPTGIRPRAMARFEAYGIDPAALAAQVAGA